MNINATVKVGALFKLVCHKGDPNKPTKQTDWFHNLVLDSGLNRLSVGRADLQLNIGTGNSTPVVTQTNLDAYLASTTSVQTQTSGRNMTNPSVPYWWGQRTFRFNPGVGTGNIAELGLAWANNACFNRALVKDISGNPTVIQKLADEYLDVLVEVRVYPQVNISGSFNLRDKTDAIVSTHTYTGKALLNADPGGTWALGQVAFNTVSNGMRISNAAMPTDLTTNVGNEVFFGSTTNTTYPTTKSAKGEVVLALASANNTHLSFSACFAGIVTGTSAVIGYKWQISPAITKLNTWELRHNFTISWDRYTP